MIRKLTIGLLLLINTSLFGQWNTNKANPFYPDASSNTGYVFGGFMRAANIQDYFKWQENDHIGLNLGHLRLYYFQKFDRYNSLFVSSQNRFFYGKQGEQSAFIKDLKTNNDLINLNWVLLEGNKTLLHSEIDIWHYQWKNELVRIKIGKQRFWWSQSYLWSANNYMNTYSILGFDIDNRSGVESGSAKFRFGKKSPMSLEVAAAPRRQEKNSVYSARLLWEKGVNEFQLVGGKVLNDYTVGVGWTGDMDRGAEFSGEITYFRDRDNAREVIIADLAYLKRVNRHWLWLVEVAYHSNPKPLKKSLNIFTEAGTKDLIVDELQFGALIKFFPSRKFEWGAASRFYWDDKTLHGNIYAQLNMTKDFSLYAGYNIFGVSFENSNLIPRKQLVSYLIYHF
ncbi:MAG: hypothetical protein N4A45_02540 [Flavobacteriales bacterium]|jgi:hypothetical protein|nr:hypothetical protein [Flavobacteriales bacterium]